MKTIRIAPVVFAICGFGCASNDNAKVVDPLPAAASLDVVALDDATAIAATAIQPENVDAAFDQLVREIEGGK